MRSWRGRYEPEEASEEEENLSDFGDVLKLFAASKGDGDGVLCGAGGACRVVKVVSHSPFFSLMCVRVGLVEACECYSLAESDKDHDQTTSHSWS